MIDGFFNTPAVPRYHRGAFPILFVMLALSAVAVVAGVIPMGCNTLPGPEVLESVQGFVSAVSAAVPVGLAIYEAIQSGRNDEAQTNAEKYSAYLDKLEAALAVAEPYLPPNVSAMARDVIAKGRLILAGLSGAKSATAAPNIADYAAVLRTLKAEAAKL